MSPRRGVIGPYWTRPGLAKLFTMIEIALALIGMIVPLATVLVALRRPAGERSVEPPPATDITVRPA